MLENSVFFGAVLRRIPHLLPGFQIVQYLETLGRLRS